jgi:hypothetical protein
MAALIQMLATTATFAQMTMAVATILALDAPTVMRPIIRLQPLETTAHVFSPDALILLE